jgi:DNA gyrase inhibitor GyrI
MKTKKLATVLTIAVLTCLGSSWLISNSRAATETPDYTVVLEDGKAEIRDYPSLVVASTTMEGGGNNGGFMQLFRYITGANVAAEKIEMTSPVLIDSGTEKRTMSFIMPATTAQKGAPQPSNSAVSVNKVAAARFAVMRFDGRQTRENEAKAGAKLKAWMEKQKIEAQGELTFAYYDPPWTPVFMRRNEVMVRIAPDAGNPRSDPQALNR